MQELSEFTIADLAMMHIGTYSEKEYDFALAILKVLQEPAIKKVNMTISMDKKYTRDGEPFIVLTVTKPGNWPVLGYTPNGSTYSFSSDGIGVLVSLVEVSPYADFVIDEKVMVRNHQTHCWQPAHFAGVDSGLALGWSSGATKWTSDSASLWQQCRRPTADELAE